MKKDECRFKVENKGYALLTAVLAVCIFAVMITKARTVWETEIRRDLEQELIFRGRQYVIAIENFRKKNPNMFPQTLDELFEKKCLRKRFLDPMTKEGKWNVVMRSGIPGEDKNSLLVVPEDMLSQYVQQASIMGVCSASCEEGFLVYRKKKKYCEWAFYLGEQPDKDMPELKFVAGGPGDEDKSGKGEEQIEERERGEQIEKREPGERKEPDEGEGEEEGSSDGRDDGKEGG
jgi:hypothetical protein